MTARNAAGCVLVLAAAQRGRPTIGTDLSALSSLTVADALGADRSAPPSAFVDDAPPQ